MIYQKGTVKYLWNFPLKTCWYKRRLRKWFIKSRFFYRFKLNLREKAFLNKNLTIRVQFRMAISRPNKNPNNISAVSVNFLPRRNLVEVYATSVSLVESKNKRIPEEKKRLSTGLARQLVSLLKTRSTCTRTRLYRQTDGQRERERERDQG